MNEANGQPKKILILYTSVGLGHKAIAQNIGAALEREGFSVRLEDILQVEEGRLVSSATGIHQFINRRLPFVWSWLYSLADTAAANSMSLPLRLKIAARNSARTKKILDEFRPDMVITTQTTASAVIAALKRSGAYRGLFGIAFSDYHFHKFWVYPGADFYLANIPEQKETMAGMGVPAERIFVCGMTLKPKPAGENAEAGRRALGIAPGEKVVLAASGSLGTGFDAGMLRQLLSLPNVRVAVVCGKNAGTERMLRREFGDTNLIVLGFADMPRLYAIADVFVTKPGGLSVAEALQWGLPMAIHYWLPGQEALNYRYLLQRRLILPRGGNIVRAVADELDTGRFRRSLRDNAWLAALVSEGAPVAEAVHSFL